MPADLVGTRIYNQKTGEFHTSLGPVFSNLLLADEINRAPAKVQSALLEVMQERQVTIAGETHRVPEPFLVMATQNPIETEGTYPLPEAQVDRFMMKVLVDYPTEEEEFVIVERVTGARADAQRGRVHRAARALQRECRAATSIPRSCSTRCGSRRRRATRSASASRTRQVHHLRREPARLDPCHRRCARARLPARRDYALPEDVTDLVPDVLRHRLVLSYEALAEGLSADELVKRVMQHVRAPAKPLRDACPRRKRITPRRSSAGSTGR